MTAPPRPNLRLTLPPIMTVTEVARLLNLDPRTVTRHDADLQPFFTLGGSRRAGNRRFRREIVAEIAERPLLARWSQ